MSTSDRDIIAWIIARLQEGWSQYDIERELKKHYKISQPTISRNIDRILRELDLLNGPNSVKRRGITKKMRSAVRALFDYQAEQARITAEEDARIKQGQVWFLEFMDALDEWREFNVREAKRKRESEEAESAFRIRQANARAVCLAVNECLKSEGLMSVANNQIYGDGLHFVSKGIPDFDYATKGAETIGFLEPDRKLPGGWAAEELRKGITTAERQRSSAVESGIPRPARIGVRDAFLVPGVPHIDGTWFWGTLKDDVATWYELRAAAPDWWRTGGGIPRLPADTDIDWYGSVLDLETSLLKRGYQFEKSILGWSDDWAEEVEEKSLVLRALERRSANLDTAVTTGRIAAILVGAASILALIWFVVIPFLVSMIKGFAERIRQAWSSGWRTAETFGDWVAQAFEAAVTSPITVIVFIVMTILLFRLIPTDRESQKLPAYPWLLGTASIVAVVTLILVVIWAGHILAPAMEAFADSGT